MTVIIISCWSRRPRNGSWSVWAIDDAPPPVLPPGWTLVPVGQLVNAVAHRLRDSLIALDGLLFSGHDPIVWAASGIAERNPYTMDLIRNIATAIALVETARLGSDILVLTADPGLAQAMATICAHARLETKWRGRSLSPWQHAMLCLRAWINFVRDGYQETKAMRRHRLNAQRVRGCATWLMSWTRANITPNQDLFFGTLPRALRNAGLDVASVGNPMVWIDGIDAIAHATATSDGPITLVTTFWGVGTRLRVLAQAVRMLVTAQRTMILDGVDVSPLITRALAQEAVSGVAPRAMLYYEIGRSCAALGLRPRVLIYTYENQPWEKQLIAGFRRYCPETVLIGIQHAPFAPLYFSADPSPWQCKHGLFPDSIIVAGTAYRDRLMGCGIPSERIILGGAFRFPQIASRSTQIKPITGLRTVLVSLPLQIDQAKELVTVAIRATIDLTLQLIITFHPSQAAGDKAKIRQADFTSTAIFSELPVRDLLHDADLLIYNSSGAVFDATAVGVPSIYVLPRAGLDLGKLPTKNPITCTNADNLRAELIRLATDPDQLRTHAAILREHLGTIFSIPNEALIIDTCRQLTTGRP